MKVFQGIDPVEPYLLRDWLTKNGLVAEVRGFDLMSALGEVPAFMGGYPNVWVHPDQVSRAHELIKDFETTTVSAKDWTCGHCEEPNPGEFASCWSCGKDGPNLS